MNHIRRNAAERGQTRTAWLDSRHSFSFADYIDPAHMGFGPLRVINDDRIAAGGGFPMHPHRDMEIVTYVLDGALAHRDSLGNGSVIRPGDVQRMSAGTGIRHSEFNASQSAPVHLLQIWIVPNAKGLAPGYEQKTFAAAAEPGRLNLIASRDGREGSVTIHQDVDLYAGRLAKGDTTSHAIAAGRGVWLQVARGSVSLDGETLREGDGLAIANPGPLHLAGGDGGGEALLFDMRT